MSVTCAFDPRSCRHPSLFLAEYKRTNRTKGTKILRCFPHCCPEHVNRSYCGTALYVRVTASAATSTTAGIGNGNALVVFAHFEESDAHFLSEGDEIPASVVAESIQTEQTPKGEWIEGFRESVTADEETHTQQNTQLFEINPGARWYYEWESAATKAQRFTKHVLRVYVLERSYTREPPLYEETEMLRVVAVATSSEFMVVSYRRAASEIRADRRILAMLAGNAALPGGGATAAAAAAAAAAGLQASSVDGDSDGGSVPLDAMPLLLQHAHYAAAANEKHAQLPLRRYHSSPTTSQDFSPLRHMSSGSISISSGSSGTHIQDHGDLMWQEKKLWESSHPETLMLTKHLAIIYYFLASADAMRFTHCLSQWSTIFAEQWRSPQASAQAHTQAYHAPASSTTQRYHPYGSSPDRADRAAPSSANAKVSWYFMMKLASSIAQVTPYQHSRISGGGGEELHSERLSLLIETCADMVGWLVFDVDNIRLFHRLFAEYAPTLLNKDALRGTFVKWVRLVYDLVGHFLASSTSSTSSSSSGCGHFASTQALVEDIIAIVFKCDELQALRPKVLSILSSTSMLGLAGFVAQVRSQFVRKSQQGSNSPEGTRSNMALTRVLQAFTSPLQGSWHFDGAQTVVEPLDLTQANAISVGGTLDWLRECSVVTLQVQDESRLAIRSLWNVSSPGDESDHANGMVLVADGHARVFSHFPSGLSSMIAIGDRRYGDYQASFTAPDALALELYAWSDSGSTSDDGFYARERATPSWGSERDGATTAGGYVMRWKLRVSLERFGRPTATPGASLLRVDAVVERGCFRASRGSAVESDSLQGRLSAVDEWKALYRVSAAYRRVR